MIMVRSKAILKCAATVKSWQIATARVHPVTIKEVPSEAPVMHGDSVDYRLPVGQKSET